MARPTKPVDVMSKNLTKEELQARKEAEAKLKGSSDSIFPSDYLNDEQKAYFEEIVKHYEASGILSNIDVAVIEQYAKARYFIEYIDTAMNREPDKTFDKDLMITREKWEKSFNRASNELGLSPQSRAKLGNINTKKAEDDGDPLLNALKRVK